MKNNRDIEFLKLHELIAIVVLMACVLFATATYAQTNSQRKFSYELQAGTSIGLFSFRGMENYSGLVCVHPKLGMDLGFTIEYKICEDLRLQSGISLVQHGAVITFSDPDPNCTSTNYQRDEMMFTYLQLPVLLRAGKEKGIYGCFGLALSVPVKVTEEFERQDVKWTSSSAKETINYKGVTSTAVKDLDPLRLAAVLKVGYVFKNNFGMFAGFDVAMGSPNSSTRINDSNSTVFSFNDSGMSLGISYKF